MLSPDPRSDPEAPRLALARRLLDQHAPGGCQPSAGVRARARMIRFQGRTGALAPDGYSGLSRRMGFT